MNARATTQWFAGATMGVLLVATVGAGTAAAEDVDDQGIDVSVDITDQGGGELSMTVAANEGVDLVEEGSDESARQFVGTTPTVTVTDTRDPADIPEGHYWAVLGQAGEFVDATDGTKTIGAEYLGWTPTLLSESSTGLVSEGEPVDSAVDAGPGLAGQELLVSTWESGAESGTWDVAADLALRTPTDVEAGSYSSTITLTLMEQSF
ncbi:hypothetical protein [Isoptericola sp. AK164]|uniref:hypothetical protein n=1 Tax=Isoptericola sp. AK164 TaxID=3024246 RepID=UPI00241848E1|nr:hypothetical protein [Isoptericola sp. AK164]